MLNPSSVERAGRLRVKVGGYSWDVMEAIVDPFACPASLLMDTISGRFQEWVGSVAPMIDNFGPGIYGDGGNVEEAVRFTSVEGLTIRGEVHAPHHATREELYRPGDSEGGGERMFHQMAVAHCQPVFRAQYGRRFFRTKKGYIGTGPLSMCIGDEVCLLLGGSDAVCDP
jgi:hypothetical protein